MPVKTIFFELHATLIDAAKLYPCAASQLGQIMAERYGGTADHWTSAYARIHEDWDSYHTDLDYGGEDGLDQVYEGLYRTTRALFRLTHIHEPERKELQALSRELPALISLHCDAVRPEVRTLVALLDKHGCQLGITSHVLENQARALLHGGQMRQHFKAPIMGVDTLGQFTHDVLCYQRVSVRSGASPQQCLIVDRALPHLEAAKAAGMQTAWLTDTPPSASPAFIDVVLPGTLAPLLSHLTSATEASEPTR
jgi:FMN phosphatase YigB (HAD superfamily)